ncbi:MAG TPA: penicillin-binding protein activator [Alphaproteobacteria bacterium]|nr:penicillin-binding protein activator [Alphaproteobacteria bacterium]
MTMSFFFCSRSLVRRFATTVGVVALAAVMSGCTPTQRPVARVPEARPAPQATAPEAAPPPITSEPAPITPIPGEPIGTGKARVALLLPLSGPNANLGRAMLNAASLALFAADSDTVELLPRDTEGLGGAAGATADAINEGAELILGPIFAASVTEIAPVARQHGVPVVAFSNDVAVAGNGVYVMGFTPENQIQRVVSLAQANGARRFAALVPDNAFGSRAADALQKVVAASGGQVTRLSRYASMETQALSAVVRQLADYDQRRAALRTQRAQLVAKGDEASRAALRRLDGVETAGDPDFDALLIPEGGARLRAIAPLLSFYDIDTRRVRLLGTFDWNDPLTETEPSLNGGWYPAPPPEARAEFEREYHKTFGAAPPRIASLAFDATLLAAVIARTADTRPRFTAERLTQPNGFAGVDGIFRLNSDGAAERGLAVIEVRLRASRIISPAPTSFNPPSN